MFKNIWFFACLFVSLHPKALPRSVAGVISAREESPGSTGRPTSENGSYW